MVVVTVVTVELVEHLVAGVLVDIQELVELVAALPKMVMLVLVAVAVAVLVVKDLIQIISLVLLEVV